MEEKYVLEIKCPDDAISMGLLRKLRKDRQSGIRRLLMDYPIDPIEYLAPVHALVVEDDLWMKPLIMQALRTAIPGVQVDWVDSVEEASRRTRFQRYRMIISDIHLKPNKENGLDFWRFCRDECPEVPILLMSSMPVDDFVKKMGLYGPHYLPKPFSISECAEVIKSLVSHSGLAS